MESKKYSDRIDAVIKSLCFDGDKPPIQIDYENQTVLFFELNQKEFAAKTCVVFESDPYLETSLHQTHINHVVSLKYRLLNGESL